MKYGLNSPELVLDSNITEKKDDYRDDGNDKI
jgi:hypothetical protein